jgi:hypothetical protein
LSSLWKEFFPEFIVEKSTKAHIFQVVLLKWLEVTHVYLKRNPSVLEAEAPSTFFLMRNEFVFESHTYCYWSVSRRRLAIFFPKFACSSDFEKLMYFSKENDVF